MTRTALNRVCGMNFQNHTVYGCLKFCVWKCNHINVNIVMGSIKYTMVNKQYIKVVGDLYYNCYRKLNVFYFLNG